MQCLDVHASNVCGTQVMPSNFQIRGMHTVLRDKTTSNADFVFYSNRLNRLVVEAGLGHLPFREKTVVTPTGERGTRPELSSWSWWEMGDDMVTFTNLGLDRDGLCVAWVFSQFTQRCPAHAAASVEV